MKLVVVCLSIHFSHYKPTPFMASTYGTFYHVLLIMTGLPYSCKFVNYYSWKLDIQQNNTFVFKKSWPILPRPTPILRSTDGIPTTGTTHIL